VAGPLTGQATATGNKVSLTTAVILDSSLRIIPGVELEVPAAYTLTVDPNVTLEVASGGTFTLKNTLTVSGTVSVAGTLDVTSNGAINVESGGTLTLTEANTNGNLKGTITVKDGGISKDLQPGGASLFNDINDDGSYVFAAGAKGYIGGEAPANLRIGGPNDNDTAAVLKLTTGTLEVSATGYELDGDATVCGYFGLSGGAIFTVKAGKKLTVDIKWEGSGYPGNDLPYGAYVLSQSKIVGEAGSVIEIRASTLNGIAGGLIYVDNAAGDNFYNSSGTQLTHDHTATNTYTAVPAGTYTWDATLGSGEPKPGGWKEEE
jgi:hypothetical protein